jgi:hypothetical protein
VTRFDWAEIILGGVLLVALAAGAAAYLYVHGAP